MNMSTLLRPVELVGQMTQAAKAKFTSAANWAKASGLPKETLSRLKTQPSCDLRTLGALAKSVGFTLVAVREAKQGADHLPDRFDRDYEDNLLDLAASGNVDPHHWRAQGPGFFMGGLAVMLASTKGFERERYLRLAEALHPGVTTPEVFDAWLRKSPLRASRFLPMVKRRRRLAA